MNDTYGHLAGDYVLKEMCNVIRSNIRREDLMARYGGEEFVIVLPEIDEAGAKVFAEKVRKIVEIHEFVFDDINIPITISVGVSTIFAQKISVADFIKVVDEKLYEAKAAGRNCTRF